MWPDIPMFGPGSASRTKWLNILMFEILSHTADVRLHVSAPDLASLFRDAAAGMIAILDARVTGEPRSTRRIAIAAPDATVLLVDFLNELLWIVHAQKEAWRSIEFEELTESSLVATVHAAATDGWAKDIKAVTYHEADVRCEDGRWSTMLVLDV